MQLTSLRSNTTDLNQQMQSCTDCPLHQNTTQAVPGLLLGDKADIMFIGEGPGADEDRLGKPFVGRAGQLLQSTLQELNIINNIYITNIVKHRPPNNRKPTQQEQDICNKLFLTKEITSLSPKIIVCLGRTPAEFLLRWSYGGSWAHSGSLRSRTFMLDGKDLAWKGKIPTLCTWHPAFILRRQDKLDELKEDIRSAHNKISRIKT